MSILKIKDAQGNWKEIPAIGGGGGGDTTELQKEISDVKKDLQSLGNDYYASAYSFDDIIYTSTSENYAIASSGKGVVSVTGFTIYRFNVTKYLGQKIHLNLSHFGNYTSAVFSNGSSLSSGFISFANDGDVIPSNATLLMITSSDVESDEIGIVYNAINRLRYGKLYGKTIYACGDSITFGANNNGVSYITKIADRNNMMLTNFAISGSTIVKTGTRGCVREQVEQMIAMPMPDYVVISGGYNDSQNDIQNALGTIKAFDTWSNQQNAFNGSYDVDTFIGGLEKMMYDINQRFPSAKFLYVITYKIIAAYKWSSEYIPALKSVLEKWSVPYIDLSSEGRLINDSHLWQRNNIFTDGTHPNDLGYSIIADLVETKLKDI